MKKDLNKELRQNLKNWKEIVRQYQIPSAKKATAQILTSFVPFIALWVLMYFSMRWSIWLTVGLGLLNGFFLVRIFIIQHDCGHQSFTGSKAWNNLIGFCCSFFSSIPYKYWAKVHNFHHGHSGQIEVWDIGDIPTLTVKQFRQKSRLGKLVYRVWRNPVVTFVIAPVYYLIVSNRLPLLRLRNFRHLSISQLINNLAIGGFYIALGFLLGWKEFLFVQCFVLFIFGIIAFWFFYVQHQHEQAYKEWKVNWDYLTSAIKGSTYYKLPRVFQWLTGNIGIHHIHHLSSLIPNYNLEKCMKENAILTKYATVITFWESLKIATYKLWDEERQRMVSFKEFYRNEQLRLA